MKATTNGDTTTPFNFEMYVRGKGVFAFFYLLGGTSAVFYNCDPEVYVIYDADVIGPFGRLHHTWESARVDCKGTSSTFQYSYAEVDITYAAGDVVTCTFVNAPLPPSSGSTPARAVGGVVTPPNTFALVSPWLAVIGLVGCIGTIAVVAKTWKKTEN